MRSIRSLLVLCAALLLSLPALAEEGDPSIEVGASDTDFAPPPTRSAASTRSTRSTGSAGGGGRVEGDRPDDWAIGVGAGWTFPAQVLAPGTASVRFRLASGLTFEPAISIRGNLGGTRSEATIGGPTTLTEDGRDGLTLMAGTDVRSPLLKRGPLDLVIVGGVFVGRSSSSSNPDGADNLSNSNSLSAGASYGLGVEWFLGKNLVLSADARNPLVTWTRTGSYQELGAPDFETRTVDHDLSFGAIFMPTVRLMFHIFF